MNETYIFLIPKNVDSFKVEGYCCISLVASLYKIIAKVLSLHIKDAFSKPQLQVLKVFYWWEIGSESTLIDDEVVEE